MAYVLPPRRRRPEPLGIAGVSPTPQVLAGAGILAILLGLWAYGRRRPRRNRRRLCSRQGHPVKPLPKVSKL